MDKEDELLKRMLEEDEMPYLEDNGFTRAVMDALPPGRASTAMRRMWIVLGGTLAGCLTFGILAWDGIRVLAAEIVGKLPELAQSMQTGKMNPTIFVALSIFTLFPIAFAMREKFR